MDVHDFIGWLLIPFGQVYHGYRGEHEILAGVVTFIGQLGYLAAWAYILALLARMT